MMSHALACLSALLIKYEKGGFAFFLLCISIKLRIFALSLKFFKIKPFGI